MATPVERGDVVWVDFGTPRGSGPEGIRPALVVQNDVGNRVSPNTIIVAITTTIKRYPVGVVVEPVDSGLRERSQIDCSLMLTITKDRIMRSVAQLSAVSMAKVNQALEISLGLR